MQTKNQEENIDENDNDNDTSVEITQKKTQNCVLKRLKGTLHKYSDNDTFQLF